MTRYINKGKRTFNIKVNNNNVSWRPLEVYDLSKEEYELIKGFKEIEVLKEYSPVIDKEKEELKKLVKEQQEKIKELEKQLKKDSRNKEKENGEADINK